MNREQKGITGIIIGVVALCIIITIALMAGLPIYKVWQQGLAGEAKLKRAQQERQIRIAQAKAEEEAAEHTANAIKIVGQAAKDYPEYRQQEFIMAFADAIKEESIHQIIYVPTEANIPIIEAGKR